MTPAMVTPSQTRPWNRLRTFDTVMVLALFLMALATRTLGAWASRIITDPDSGVVALMVRNIIEKGERPVFFYGQSYMGSLEPFVSAWLCRLGGVSGFWVCMGPAILGALCVPMVYLLARTLSSRATAGIAAALCLIGPADFYAFQFAPRGGYMVTLLVGLMVMYLGSRTAADLWQRRPVSLWPVLTLGILAGIGWWTNPLVVPALAACATVLAIGLRGRVFAWPVWIGLLGFLLGSLPYWIWNFANDFESFRMAAAVGDVATEEGTRELGHKIFMLFGAGVGPGLWRTFVATLVLLLSGLGFIGAAMRVRTQTPRQNLTLLCVGIFTVLSMGLFISSSFARFNTVRYLLPLVAPFAILSAMALTMPRRPPVRLLAAAAFAVLLAAHLPGLRHVWTQQARRQDVQRANTALVSFLAGKNIPVAYGHFRHHALNFTQGGNLVYTGIRGDRYTPLARTAELSDAVSVVGNSGAIAQFVAVAGGHAQADLVAGAYRVEHSFMPPVQAGLEEIPPSRWVRPQNAAQQRTQDSISDRNRDTFVVLREADPASETIEIRLSTPTPLNLLRLFFADNQLAAKHLSISYLPERDAEWQTLQREAPVTFYHWSGPRPYWEGRRFRQECSLRDVTAVGLRVNLHHAGRNNESHLSELQLFGSSAGAASIPEPDVWGNLVQFITNHSIRVVYADRWLSNRLHDEFGDRVATEVEPPVATPSPLQTDGMLEFRRGTLLVVLRHDAPQVRAVLARFQVPCQETPLGPWTLMQPSTGNTPSPYGLPLYWTGQTCFIGHTDRYGQVCVRRAIATMLAHGSPADAIQEIRRGMEWDPGCVTLAKDVLDWVQEQGTPVDAEILHTYRDLAEPGIRLATGFANGIRLEGLTVEPSSAPPGQPRTVTLYWTCPSTLDRDGLAVFVHFLPAGTRQIAWQDDHNFLTETPSTVIANQTLPRVFRETRTVSPPASALAGAYDLRIGLYAPRTGRRLRITPPERGSTTTVTAPAAWRIEY